MGYNDVALEVCVRCAATVELDMSYIMMEISSQRRSFDPSLSYLYHL